MCCFAVFCVLLFSMSFFVLFALLLETRVSRDVMFTMLFCQNVFSRIIYAHLYNCRGTFVTKRGFFYYTCTIMHILFQNKYNYSVDSTFLMLNRYFRENMTCQCLRQSWATFWQGFCDHDRYTSFFSDAISSDVT